MMRLTLKEEPRQRLSLATLTPERLAGLGPAAVERLPLHLGNRAARVGDWFRVEPAAGEALRLAASCGKLDHIGAGMTAGEIIVEGDAGAYLGAGLAGGRLRVEGAAGFGAGTAMERGIIRIAGDAGDGIGGALAGGGGMRGGAVIVGGSAGARAGYRMRRGLIAVRGDAGPAAGGAAAAGTLLLGGRAGEEAGAAMRRGTLIALGGFARVAPSFADCGAHELVILRLLAATLRELGLAALAARLGPMRRYLGDLGVDGRGELLAPDGAAS